MKDNSKVVLFPFKGKREYVHGTDIFNYFYQQVSDFKKLTLSFHEVSLSPRCHVYRLKAEESPPDNKAALFSIEKFSIEKGAEIQRYYIAHNEDIDLSQLTRIPYDENLMVKNAEIEAKTARLTPNKAFTFIENLVALTKHLHLTHFDVSGGQWFFAQLELNASINPTGELVLKLHKNMGTRLTQSKVYQGNKEIGAIYFSYHK